MSSITASSVNKPSEDDMFVQRMRAMLSCDDNNGLTKSFSANHLQSMQNLNANSSCRPTAITSVSFQSKLNHDVNEANGNAYQSFNDELNAQIRDLSVKSALAHEKLKQLQNEHNSSFKQQQVAQSSTNELKQQENSFSSEELKQREALEKLKREQQLLKEQISMLNKQRESTQHELESLALGSLKPLHSGRNGPQKQTKSSGSDNFDNERFSPIFNENIFHQV
jgi:flagellar biosynthesis regulator FlaF